MEVQAQGGASGSSDANDVITGLTQNLPPETAQYALQLAMAMKNASEDQYKAVLELLSKPKMVADSDEKPAVETDGIVALGDVKVDGYNDHGSLVQSPGVPEACDNDDEVGDHEGIDAGDDLIELNGQEDSENGSVADDEPSHQLGATIDTSDNNSCDAIDKSVVTLAQSPGAPEACDNDDEVGDHEGINTVDDLIELNGQQDSENGSVADDEPSHQLGATIDTSGNNSFDAIDKSVVTPSEDQKLAELSDEAEELADPLSTANENLAGFLQESVSSSEDEKLPELLPNKAEDISSDIGDVDDEEPIESLSDGLEIIRASVVEETPSLQQTSLLNSLPQSVETKIMEKNEAKIDDVDDESSSSSDDDQMASSSSHSVVTSSESELSDAVMPSDSLANQSEGAIDDVRNIEAARNTLSMTGSKDDDIAIIEDELLHAGAGKEPVTNTMPVLEGMFSLSSTGTQTSCENLHFLKDQRFNTFGRLEHQNLDNILGGKDKASSKLPFYYQPQIVMHDEKPILVLQPVPSFTSLSNSGNNIPGVENGAVKATVPIILPLGSPHIDKATKDAIFQKINGAGAFPSDQGVVEDLSLKSYSSAVAPSENANVLQPNGMATVPNKSIPITENWAEASKCGKTEALPEWVPSSELDKAFSAAGKETTASTVEHEPTALTFPRVSLPSTNPFAKDLAAQEFGHSEAKADNLLNFGLEVTSQYSLFGPPSSPSLSQGARPKEVKVYHDPGHVGNATNPFSPDLTPKNQARNQGRRQEPKAVDSTEVVVAAEVHTSVGQHISHRRRLSSESMVTLIETSYDDPSVNSVESLGADEPNRIVKAETVQEPKPQQRSMKTSSAPVKPKLKVPGKVAPVWIPDCVCFNCTSCNIKFTLFIRKHHCRGCGKIFCNSCCSQLARFPYMEFKIGRVCTSCTEAIKEVTRLKRIEDSSKPRPIQQSPVKNQAATTAPGLPQESSVPQTRQLPQGTVATNAQAQRNLTTPRSATPSAAVMPLNQGQPRNVSNPPVQYQPLTWPPKSSVKVQNPATPAMPALVPSNQLQQGSQDLMKPAQPANQYMWVPASAVQPSMPVVYMNPVAPSLQGTPMFVTYPQAGQFIPQQAPVMLVPSEPSSTSRLPRTTTQAAITTTSGSWKGVAPVSNRSSAETVTTFSVLPQHVGQLAVQSAQRQPTTTANHASSTASVVPSSSIPQVVPSTPQSSHQTTSVQNQLISTTGAASTGLPSSRHQSPPPAVTTAAPSPRLSHAVGSSSSGGRHSQESLTGSQRSRESDGTSVLAADETELNKDLQPPLRRAGRTITWRCRTQGKSKLQEQKKSLAKDLKDLPHGVTVQASQDLLIHIKKMKLKEGSRDICVWCYQSEGLNKFNHLEVVVMLETRKKEEIFPEEVLRVYRGILHLASTLDNRFEHGNYLSSNNQFLDSSDDAGFILVSSELKPKPLGLKEMKAPFLYGILVKRSELSAAMFTPSRLLLRLGNKMNSFPFPLWNNRDRRAIKFGNEQEDRFFHTVFAMNKYLKNSVPEAMIPGLYVVKEDNKIILQVPSSGRSAVVGLLDRLIKKENQTATVPLLADIPPYVNNCKIVVCNERGGKSVQSFGNAANTSVVGLGFLLLHLGVDASSPLSFGGELLDDGVLVFFSKSHTQKLRQSLEAKTNCYFFLGDKFDIAHFELRWVPDVNYHEIPKPAKDDSHRTISNPATATTAADATAKESGADSYPGIATIDIRYSGYGNEVELVKKVFDDYGKILQILEGNIRQACTDPLMKHANKMRSGENQDLQLRVVLRSSYKKWSVGPSDLPTALIRSLQMTLHTVKVPVVFEGELVMSFDVSVVKQ